MTRNAFGNKLKRSGLSACGCLFLAAVFLTAGCAAQADKKPEPGERSADPPVFDQKTPPDSEIPKFPVDAVVHFEAKHRTIILAKAENLTEAFADDAHFNSLREESRFEDIALEFVSFHRKNFKLDAPVEELRADSVRTDEFGLTHVRFHQVFSRIPIRGCEITVHLNPEKNVYMVQGRYIPTPNGLAIRPVLKRGDALRTAAQDLEDDSGCRSCAAELVIHPSDDPRLVWRVQSDSGLAEKWTYVIDAQTGEILKKESDIRTQK